MKPTTGMCGGQRAMGGWLGRLAGSLVASLVALVALVALVTLGSARAETAAPSEASARVLRPVEDFASLPLVSQVALSPNGQRYAAIVNSGDETRIVTRAFDEPKPLVALSTDNRAQQFNWMRWVNDERLVVSLRVDPQRGPSEGPYAGLISVRFDGSGQVSMLQAPPRTRFAAPSLVRVVDWMDDDPKVVLMQTRNPQSERSELIRVDVESGERERVVTTAYSVGRWVTDAQHQARLITRRVDEDTTEVLLATTAADSDGGWRSLWRFNRWGPDMVTPLGFGRNPNLLFVSALHQGRDAVFAVDLQSPTLERKLVLADAQHDVRGILMRAANGEVIGIADASDPSNSAWWDPGVRELSASLDKVLPGRFNRLLQFSRDGARYLVYSSGNGLPGRFYFGDRATGRMTMLGAQYPALDKAVLAGKQLLRIRARDGLELRAHLTRPRGAPAGPLPLVLMPHGGPGSHDGPDFTPMTEFLADRGYAVLQVDFRGSSGFGREFWAAGLQRWGLDMQDDLTDAVEWAIGQKVADKRRVCIVGGSYGGYAALMGVVKTPSLYRCAVSLNGVTDLFELFDRYRAFPGATAAIEKQLGHAWQDRERLRATSPALQADRIQVPVLLVHGTLDRTVPVAHSRLMARALAAADKPHQLLELDDADHALSRQPHRVAYYKALEAFLAQHLSP